MVNVPATVPSAWLLSIFIVPELRVTPPVNVLVPESIALLVPVFVKPSVPELLLITSDNVKSCPSAPAAVVPPIFKLKVFPEALSIAELIVRADP